MSNDNQLAVRPRASHSLATLMGMEPAAMLDTIKAQCFKGNPQNISDAQLAAFVSIAAEMGVNPLLPGMLYAFPIQGGGIVPMMGPDGVYKKLTEHPDVDSWETEVFPSDVSLPPTHATTKIWRKGRERPLSYTALLSEWKVGSNPNWNTRTRHMLGLRSLKQAARQIIHGIPFDEDERVMMNVTDTVATEASPQSTTPDRPAPRPRATRGAAAAKAAEVVVEQEPAKPEEKPAAEAAPQDNARLEADLIAREAKLAAMPTGESPEAKAAAETEKAKLASEAGVAAPRAFLNDGEEATFLCTVKSLKALEGEVDGKKAPSVLAEVTGGFNGSVRHFGGASADGKGAFTPNAPWAVGAELKLTLKGQKSKAAKTKADGTPNPSYGRVVAWVQGITSAEAAQGATEFDE